MTSELPTAHSPLGGSGAPRWMKCPGSVNQSEGVPDPESDFAAEGTAAHELGEACLKQDADPWMFIGQQVYGHGVDKEMADAVQYYMTTLGEWHRSAEVVWVEKPFHCPSIHQMFYGRIDYGAKTRSVLDVWDYKHGAGVVIEPDSPQLKYYACGMLESMDLWNETEVVRTHIVQPRAWHADGQHRYWETTTEDLVAWLEDECIPAMELAEVSRDTEAGEHCRFCPARSRQCPALMEAMAEYIGLVIMADKRGADALTPEQLGTLIALEKLSKIVIKEANRTAYGMLASGHDVPHVKLVKSRTNRVFKDGAEDAAVEEFGDKAMSEPKLKSPAQIDEMPGGKAFTAQWAYKPEGAMTVAHEGDPRKAIKRGAKSLFKPVRK